MRKVVGIDRKIKRSWVDAVLDRLTQTTDERELRTFLDKQLKGELPGKESRAKTVGIVLRIWSGIPPERIALRDRAVALLPRISGQERIWLHWGMTALAYPFFRDTAEVVGRLLALQDDFTTAQVQARMLTTWGDRATSKEAAQKLVTTLVDWEVLRSTKTRGHFLLARKMTASIPDLQLWLLEALLGASAADEIEAQQLLRLPESFPFTISVGVADLRKYEGFNIHRQGLDMDMVALRKIRVPLIHKPKLKPILASEPPSEDNLKLKAEQPNNHTEKVIQPSLFDKMIEDVASDDQARQPVATIPKATMPEMPEDSDASNQALDLVRRFNTDRELLTTTAYSDGGLKMLFARLERAAMNQAEHGDATLARYAIWANTVRDHISEALRLIRDSGDRGEAERLLALAHNSMSAFSEIQALLDPAGIGRPEMKAPESTPEIELQKPAKATKKVASKSDAVAAALPPPPSATVMAELASLKALSVRQPNAEAIMRGVKTTDYRSTATKFRGRILIYASLGRDDPSEEARTMKEHCIDDVAIDDLPRGVLIGTVELHDSDGSKWYLRSPQRLDTLVKPTKQPKPVWFNPF